MKVIDANVGVKWFFDEPRSAVARAPLSDQAHPLIVPAVFAIELYGAIVRASKMQAPEAMIERL